MNEKGMEIFIHLEGLENELLHKSGYSRQSLFWEMTDLLITDKGLVKV